MSRIRAFTMPKWGIEMTEGTIAEWKVAEGDRFTPGQTLCLIETAKISNEVEAEYEATVRRIIIGASDEAARVGTLLAVFDEGEHTEAEIDAFVAEFRPAEGGLAMGAAPASTPAPAPAAAPVAARIATNRPISPEALRLAEEAGVDLGGIEGSGRNGRITYQDVHRALRGHGGTVLGGPLPLPPEDLPDVFASPLARRLAQLHAIDLAGVAGTGPRGRICKADVLALVPAPASERAASAAFVPVDNRPEIIPFDRIRQVVAKRLVAAKQEIPHFYLRISAHVDALLELRRVANLVLGCKASVNDWLIKAAAEALVRHPDVNIQVHGNTVHRFPHADISVAVAAPKGLLTPVVRQANRMRIDQLAAETRRLIDKAQGGTLQLDEMEGGSFSISNLGMFGVESFDAIVNPPQGAILAVGAARRQQVERTDGSVGFQTRIALTLSVDHRGIDGAAGARFLETLKNLIEQPENMLG